MSWGWLALLLLLPLVPLLLAQLLLPEREGRSYLKQLQAKGRWQVNPDELPRLRRGSRWAKHLFGWLSLLCILMIFSRLSAGTPPPGAFTAASGLLLLSWASLQFPGHWKAEWRSFGALLVFTCTFPWVMLLLDWIVGLHPSFLLGFSRDLEWLGVESPNKFQLACFVTLMLSVTAVLARVVVILLFNIPALLLANALSLTVRRLSVAPAAIYWPLFLPSVVALLLLLVLSWRY